MLSSRLTQYLLCASVVLAPALAFAQGAPPAPTDPPPPPPAPTATPPPPPAAQPLPPPPVAPPPAPPPVPSALPPGPPQPGWPPAAGGYPPHGNGQPPPGQHPSYGYPPDYRNQTGPPRSGPPQGWGPQWRGGGGYGVPPLPPPKYLPYHDGEAAPPGYIRSTKVRKGLIIGGAVTLGSMYLLSSAAGSALVDDNSDGDDYIPLFVPVVGPFITIGTSESSAFGSFILVLDGLGQSAGLAMLIAGIAAPKDVWLRSDLASVTFGPIPIQGGLAGFGLNGEF